jgi:hypothetical protein
MTKPTTWLDLARSLDADWPPHQPVTLTELKTATMKPKTGVDLARKDLGKLPLGTRQGVDEASGRDGRPDTGKCDRLLERLMKVHGEMRHELLKKK